MTREVVWPGGEICGKAVIFLAGPIIGAPPWQDAAVKHFDAAHMTEEMENATCVESLTVLNPRFGGLTRRHLTDREAKQQADWERDGIEYAGAHGTVMFWLAKQETPVDARGYARTSRFELGLCVGSGFHVTLGIEPGFPGERYLRHAAERSGMPVYSSLRETCAAAYGYLVSQALQTE